MVALIFLQEKQIPEQLGRKGSLLKQNTIILKLALSYKPSLGNKYLPQS
jgi:hypothetical protein